MRIAVRRVLLACAAALACAPSEDPASKASAEAARLTVDIAAFDATLGAPTCAAVGAGCSSAELLQGRGPLGPESNAPNTLGGSCADGASGAYLGDESLEALSVETLDGTELAAGKPVLVTARVWAYGGYQDDHLDLFLAADAREPEWQLIGTFTPAGAGFQTLSAELDLPGGALQAIRGVFRYRGAPSSCPQGEFDEADDLVFAVSGGILPPDDPPDDPTLERAALDTSLLAPACTAASHGCTSADLLATTIEGFPEPNAPNTVWYSCWDVTGPSSGTPSIERIQIATVGGAPLDAGQLVRVTVDASGLEAGVPVDVFEAPNAEALTFTHLARFVAGGSFTERFQTTFTLPRGRRQVVRAVAGAPDQPVHCGGADHDDLVFATVLRPAEAEWSAQYGAPACSEASPRCESGSLLAGRAWLGPEANTPNTLDGCGDGGSQQPDGSSDPSVEVLRVFSADGDVLRAHQAARVEATVRALEGTAVDFFVSDWADAGQHVVWRYLGRVRAPAPGLQTVGVPFATWYAGRAAVRAVVFEDAPTYGWEQSCSSWDPFGDTDDLVFTVDTGEGDADAGPPTAQLVSPVPDSTASLPLHIAVDASDDVLLQRVEYWVNGYRVGMSFEPSFTFDWNPASPPVTGEIVQVRALAFDGLGSLTVAGEAWVTFGDLTPPTVSFLAPGAIVGQKPIALEVQAEDDWNGTSGVAQVEFLADGTSIGTATAPPWTSVWDASAAEEGPHILMAMARDLAGNTGVAEVTVLVDGTPPSAQMINPAQGAFLRGVVPVDVVSADANGDNVGLVRVDGIARGHVFNGTPYLWNTQTSPDGPHVLMAEVYDRAFNLAVAGPIQVVVDNTAPTVAITEPAAGLVPGDVVVVAASAADAMGLAHVVLLADGVPIATLTAPPYATSWDTAGLAEGTHTITARATDRAGNTSSASVSVAVDRSPPVVSITAPQSVQNLRGAVTLLADASDANGVARVEFWARAMEYSNSTFVLVGTASAAPFTATWETAQGPDGRYSLYARAIDGAGREATSAMVTDLIVDNTAPIVTLISPRDGAALSGSVPFQISWIETGTAANATQLTIDGAETGWSIPARTTWSWNTTWTSNGVHTLRVLVRDVVGNVGSSAPIYVRIVNGAPPSQLLADAGFESGAPGAWVSSSAVFDGDATPPARTGQFKASLRGLGTAGTDWVRQGFVVPATARTLTFRYWFQVNTDESTWLVRDRLYVRLLRASGSVITTLASHSNLDETAAGWIEKTVTLNVTGIRGQSVALAFEGNENSGDPTSFHLDDVTVIWSP